MDNNSDYSNNERNNRIEKQILIKKNQILNFKQKIVKLDRDIDLLKKRKR